MALIAHTASYRARVPFIHFFDGFRTSHEVSKLSLLTDEQIAAVIDEIVARGLRPVMAGKPERLASPFLHGFNTMPVRLEKD